MSKAKRLRLSFFLVKPGIEFDKTEEIIELPEKGGLHSYVIKAFSESRDSLFLRPSHQARPRWLTLVEDHVDGDLVAVFGASSSGVLLVPAGDDLLAVSFGYGRHLLRKEAVVQDFGLRVVLNEIDPTLIKSVDARTFDELLIHTKRGVSKDSPLSAFALDSSKDLLRAVSGRSAPDGLGALSGSAALTLNTDVALPQLPQLGRELTAAYRSKHYKKNFKEIDQVRGEQDLEVIAALDARLVEALRAKEMTEMHLAIPETVDWQQISSVRFSIGRRRHDPMPDPRISVYRELRPAEKIDLKRLRSDRVIAISALDEEEIYDKWSVYDCLVFEIEHEGELFVLSGGQWYRVEETFREQVTAFAESVPELKLELPEPEPKTKESVYNEAAATALGGICMDEQTVPLGGVDRAELCDILSPDGILVHVKKRGASSTLSHLFAQGTVSCELLLRDPQFLENARGLVEEVNPDFVDLLPQRLGERDRLKVAYVVLSRGQRPDRPYGLPFFSLVNLRSAAQRLEAAGVSVFMKEVKEAH
ncbi:MAG TPA: DUF6119 family protein [Solirubrobacterales bacterium]|nr:DUF6119 family protein [Solirubrobacterales bacterium]